MTSNTRSTHRRPMNIDPRTTRIPFPLPARTVENPSGTITIDTDTVISLGLEAMYLYTRLAIWAQEGQELSTARVASELTYRDYDRAETWLSELDRADLIDWQEPAASDMHGVASMAELADCPSYERAMLRVQRGEYLRQYGPTEPDGSWSGPWPMTASDRRPPSGQNVVYLLKHQGVPIYVGSTGKFAARLSQHRAAGKRWTTWTAQPYATRAEAYAAESAYLRQHKPHLNVQGPRRDDDATT
jgi:predicted GIY-YIG superfamily endonuclease